MSSYIFKKGEKRDVGSNIKEGRKEGRVTKKKKKKTNWVRLK